ncbi:spore germination protein [Pseudalkalibacillus berkeleyi]|uniref:Spore germination protein n=1 Tax=Pseudalkalibacillus berkeleyi TaxID=1069813 RepID=A0ABS9H3H2_9BACL|nr:spore germination protein [Pseudalkalibacillus berkeleyi]MCF6138486.1 spore germination protein [Pseudalkalibacillus berkeleyi]
MKLKRHRRKQPQNKSNQTPEEQSTNLSNDLEKNKSSIKEVFTDCQDIVYHTYHFSKEYREQALVVFCETIIQNEKANLLKEVMQDLVTYEVGPATEVDLFDVKRFFIKHGVTSRAVELVETEEQVRDKILEGHIVILFQHWNKALTYDAFSVEKRSVGEPQNEVSVIGPREGTIENLTKNIGLIRSRLKSEKLKFKIKNVGNNTKSKVAYAYLEGTVPEDTLKMFKERFDGIQEEEILETSYFAELFEESTYSPFPQYRTTERPDVAVSGLLGGKIIVLVDGTPTILVCPGLFTEFFQSPSDYYQRTMFSSFIRILRIIGFIISLTLPSIYIALSTFHSELIPTVLLMAILDTREGMPFPALIEALIMIFFFEMLQEASLRLPRPIGSAVSIVGALVIGEAAINAGIASPMMVVVVALTGIASFSIPQYDFGTASRILRLPLMFAAAVLGGFGLMIGFLLIYLHLASLRSLGQPYFAPLGPIRPGAFYEFIFRSPLVTQLRRHQKDNLSPNKSSK